MTKIPTIHLPWLHPDSNYTNTGCIDCGRLITHPHPLSTNGSGMYVKFGNPHCTIYFDMVTHHFLHYLIDNPEKVFLSCKKTIEEMTDDKEIGKVLQWASIGDGD